MKTVDLLPILVLLVVDRGLLLLLGSFKGLFLLGASDQVIDIVMLIILLLGRFNLGKDVDDERIADKDDVNNLLFGSSEGGEQYKTCGRRLGSFFLVDHLRVSFKYLFHSLVDSFSVCFQYIFHSLLSSLGLPGVLRYLLHGLFRDFQDLCLLPGRVVEAAEEDSAWTGGPD